MASISPTELLEATEEVIVVDSVANPTFVYSPIINIDTFPRTLTKTARIDKKSGYI